MFLQERFTNVSTLIIQVLVMQDTLGILIESLDVGNEKKKQKKTWNSVQKSCTGYFCYGWIFQ